MAEITVIVPVYNVEKYLRRCIESILHQTYNDIEIIMVNDGSTDKSGDICDQYQTKYKNITVFHKENGGLSSARNFGLERANSPYISFIDSDDWISKDMYEHMIKLMEKNNSDIVSIKYAMVGEENTNINLKEKNNLLVMSNLEALEFYMRLGISHSINDYSVCTKLYKKSLFDDIRFPVGQYYEDVVTNFKLIKKVNKYIYSDKVCYFYFQDNSSITRNRFTNKDFDMEKIGTQLIDECTQINNCVLSQLALEKLARNYMSMLYKACKFDIDASLEKEVVMERLKIKFNNYFFVLMKSNLQFTRKVLTVMLRISPYLLYNYFRLIEKRRI